MSALRYIAAYTANEKWDLLSSFVKKSRLVVLTTATCVALIFALGIGLYMQFVESNFYQALIAAIPLLPFFALTDLHTAGLRGLGHIFKSLAPSPALRNSLLLIVFGLVALMVLPLTSVDVLLITGT